ncbi:DUF742 domain-containing protein [Actinomadura macrotermitis]|uniref:DUF742 domain-containing protein n=1 Tax=Actinomadura macrotermitis TaxID=2585200 RepID=A0A7K0BZX3_9ACTN|nr:DUF742 domain-containing protein [Actinomadura macrotermitis]MQY06616.1 hypothetical protein [Actinomadura macrotermitis]
MSAREAGPARLFVITGGRTRAAGGAALDLVTLVAVADEAPPGLASERAAILRLCGGGPLPVAELGARLALPVSVVKALLRGLLADGLVTAHPPASHRPPDLETLRQVLSGLHDL